MSSRESDLAAALRLQMRINELPAWEEEWRFHPRRKWRYDFAWPEALAAVEVEGGTWMQTQAGRSKGHAHPVRFEHDCEKYNEAMLAGWRVLRVTGEQIDNGMALAWVMRLLGIRQGDEPSPF